MNRKEIRKSGRSLSGSSFASEELLPETIIEILASGSRENEGILLS